MLHTETVASSTLELLKALMQDPNLQTYCLVGGTAAALHLGHRISVDIDLFTPYPIDTEQLVAHLRKEYDFTPAFIAKDTVKGIIQGVKIDCITHPYPMVQPVVEENGIRLASLHDIAAMKLNAIVNSGERVKDFIDIAYLSYHLSLQEMAEAFETKYKVSSLIPIRALSYWNDINFQEPIKMTTGRFDWKQIAKRLTNILKQ